MVLDISLEAIEADFRMAERGGQVADLAMARAQVRATLLAAQPADHQGRHGAPTPYGVLAGAGADIEVANGADVQVFTVPDAASWDDRVTAAAMLLAVPPDVLQSLFARAGFEVPGGDPLAAPTEDDARAGEPEEEPPVEPLVDPLRITTRNTEDDHRLSVEDDVDADFFAEAKKARKRK